jgi:hypothetical protein
LEDHQISAKSTAEQLGISRERVESNIHEDLDMLIARVFPGRAKDLSAPMCNPSHMIICELLSLVYIWLCITLCCGAQK